jgi:hypothetical protein
VAIKKFLNSTFFLSKTIKETRMRNFFIFKRQSLPVFLLYFFYILMSFLIFGCSGGGGGDANSSSEFSETGSASFIIAWHNAPVIEAPENSLITTQAQPVNCDLIENIICEVYDGSNTHLTSEVFPCSAGLGTINYIPAGENRAFVILGQDIDGNILYHGEVSGITITAGETNDLGIIDCFYFVPTLLSPYDNSDVILDQFSLNWTPVETVYEYRVQVSEDSNFDTTVIDETTPNIQYTPSGLSESATYYWKVFARDIHANQGMESQEVWSFNVIPEECTYSISPTGQLFTSSAGTGSISVSASSSTCSWTASESVDWIAIASGSSGTGDGTVTYEVSANTTSSERTAVITVDGESHTVTQDPQLSAPTLLFPQNNAVMDNNCEDYSDSIDWAFSWNSFSGATRYQIYVIGPYPIVNPIIDTIVTSTSFNFSGTGYITDANRLNWTWRVRAGNDRNEWSVWSQRSFDVEPVNTDCPCPDLIVESIARPIWDAENQRSVIQATIRNIGNTSVGTTLARVVDPTTFQPSGAPYNSVSSTPVLAPGASTTVIFYLPYWVFNPDVTLEVTADYKNEVSECDEQNNVKIFDAQG